MKKKLGGAVLATALGATLIGGGTFALFTSSASNTGNTFTAGTVVVTDTSGGPIASKVVNFNNLAPGDNGSMTMTVQNNGTLDEWVKIDTAASNATKSVGGLFGGTTPLALSYAPDVVKLAPGETHDFTVGYNFPVAADNSYQKATGSFSVVVDAVQAKNNTTGNGPTSWQ